MVERGGNSPSVGGADGVPYRVVTEPEGRAFVAEEVAPATGTCLVSFGINTVGDGTGAGHHDDSDARRSTGHEGHQGVVDDPDRLPLTEAAEDVADQLFGAGLPDAGDTETESGQRFGSFRGNR